MLDSLIGSQKNIRKCKNWTTFLRMNVQDRFTALGTVHFFCGRERAGGIWGWAMRKKMTFEGDYPKNLKEKGGRGRAKF